MNDEFCKLFRAHAAYVAESLRRLGVRAGDAEDMTHEVFLAVHRQFDTYDRARSPKPWLFAFALRMASNYRQRGSVRRELLASDDTMPDRADSSPDAFTLLERDDARKTIHGALATIPFDRRVVFVMYELDQRTMPDIARELEIPVQTAYSRLRTAREELVANVRRAELASERPIPMPLATRAVRSS